MSGVVLELGSPMYSDEVPGEQSPLGHGAATLVPLTVV